MKKLFLTLVLGLVLAISATAAAAPTVTYDTTENSGNVYIQTGRIEGFQCTNTGACNTSTYTVTLGTGYTDAEIFLSGFSAKWDQAAWTLRKQTIGLTTMGYNSVTGDFQWRADGELRRTSGVVDSWTMDMHFVIVLTKTNAHLSTGTPSCTGSSGTCSSSATTITGAVPAGMTFAGFGIKKFTLEITAVGGAGINVGEMKVDVSSYTTGSGNATPTLACTLTGSSATNMACSADLVGFAAASSETGNYTLGTVDSGLTNAFSASATHTPGINIDGGFAGMDKWDLLFASSVNNPIWKWRAGYLTLSISTGTKFNYTRWGQLAKSYNNEATDSYSVTNHATEVLTK